MYGSPIQCKNIFPSFAAITTAHGLKQSKENHVHRANNKKRRNAYAFSIGFQSDMLQKHGYSADRCNGTVLIRACRNWMTSDRFAP